MSVLQSVILKSELLRELWLDIKVSMNKSQIVFKSLLFSTMSFLFLQQFLKLSFFYLIYFLIVFSLQFDVNNLLVFKLQSKIIN